jgi:phage tail sheath protein FI
VVRSSASFYRGATVEVSYNGGTRSDHEVTDIQGNTIVLGSALTGTATKVRVLEIDITIADETGATPVTETFRALAWNRASVPGLHERHYATVINTRSKLAYVKPPDSESAALKDQPSTENAFAKRPPTATAGSDGSASLDYVGVDVAPRTGLHALSEIEDVRIVAIPGQVGAGTQSAMITHCERLRYRFAVLDPGAARLDVNDLLADRSLFDTSFAGLYAPWVEVADGDRRYLVPPSGHVAGIMARTDVERGVHKAPANEVVRGAIGLAANFTSGEQEILNPRGVDAIRRLEDRGIRVWGARTLSSDPSTKYVNVRRYLIFLEASLDRGTQWVVFEPNTPDTWTRVTDSISSFLTSQWRSGALFGRKADDAYFVRCDETTMTADDIQNGRLICHIGVAIVRPAEFVIFRIEQLTGFAKQA